MILGLGGGQRGERWIVDDTCRDLQFPEYRGDFRGPMFVFEGRAVDRRKLGGWVYQMIKLPYRPGFKNQLMFPDVTV